MIALDDEHYKPKDFFMRNYPPSMDLFTYPRNITNWMSCWLIMDDLGSMYSTRLQVCGIY